MTTFEEKLKQALDRVEQQNAAEPEENGFLAILQKLVDELNARQGLFVRADLERGPHPQRWRFVTSPRYRRDSRTVMFNVAVEADRLRVLGSDEKTFDREQDFEEYLVDFLEHSFFPETLKEYEEICRQDVDGILRAGNALDVPTVLDASVRVPAEVQKRLALASPGEILEIEVEPGGGLMNEYDPKQSYHYLSSAGFGLRLKEHTETPEGWVKLRGEVMAEGERQ